MKHFINLTIAVLILFNQALYSPPGKSNSHSVQITPTANTGETISATPTPTTTETSSFEAYPPPVESTPTKSPTETPATPTSTSSPTTIPATPTVIPTLEPSPTPTGEVPVDTPQLLLKATGSIYEPGKLVNLDWKINLPKSQSIQSNWQLQVYLPAGWILAEKQSGTFDSDKQVWKIDSPSASGKLTLIAPDEIGYFEINAVIYDGDTELFRGSLVQWGKKSIKIDKTGGEIDGSIGKAKIKIQFDKEVLPEDSVISIQAPEKFPGSLPYNGKYVMELVAEDMKGNRFHKFNSQAVIEFAFDPDQVEIHPSAMALYWYDESSYAWRVLPGHIDYQRNVYVAYTDHFSLFALGQNDWESRKVPALDVAQVASFTGAASYTIPVEVPTGPGGIKPSVGLEYNSMSMEGFYFQTSTNAPGVQSDVVVGAQPSWTGAGWSLNSGGSILRNMGKDIDWEGDDTYSLTVGNVAMKLVPVSEGSGYIDYKGTDENFWKIRRMVSRNIGPSLPYGTYGQENDTWVVWDKTGTQYTFSQRAYYLELLWDDATYHPGSTSYYNCAQGNRECIKRPWGWFIKEIKYPSGQTLTFNYSLDQDSKCFWYIPNTSTCDGGTTVDQAAYPSEILYPDGKTKITFISVARPDYVWYWGDFLTKNRYEKRRLSSIQVQVNGQIAREYQLNYYATAENPLVPGSRWTPVDPFTNGGAKNYEALSALKSVSQYGLGGINSGNKLPDITFSYTNQLLLTDINNGQGGIATFVYESIDANANNGEGSPFTAAGGDPEQNKTLYQSNLSVGLSEVSYLNPTPNNWETPNGLPVRPGQGYRITCNIRDATGQIQFGMYYSNESTGAKNYSKLVDVSSSGGTYSANVVIPASANRATPAIKYTSGGTGTRITASSCSGVPILTHYRVTQRTLRDTTTNVTYPYTYSYSGAAVNDTAHSTYAGLTASQRSGASTPYTEFRGHSKVTIIDPKGLRTETFFYQNDVNKGRVYDIKQYINSNNLLVTRSITHWIDSPIVISDSQNTNICARSAKGAACLLDQKSIWSYSDWDENRQYGQGVADENSSAYVGLHKIYQYAPTSQYGNLIGVIEQIRSGSGWTPYRLTRTSYSANVVEGGTNPNGTKYLVELPGLVNVYECANGSCDETSTNLRISSCYLYDDPINGATGLCSVSYNGSTRVEVLDTPDSGLITGVRTLLHFGDGATADYNSPHYSDELYRYDAKGNLTRTTRFTGEGSNTSIASGGAQVMEACYGVGNQPAGCADDGYYAYPRWEKNALGHTTSWTIDYVLGVPTVETDSNGAVIYATYDAFGRMKALIQPGDDSNSPTISANYYDSSPSWIEVIPKNGASIRKIYDGLGRLIQSQQGNVTLTNGSRDVVVDYEYNSLNQVTRQSVPVDIVLYPYDGSAVYRKQTSTAAITNQYDPIGRLLLSTSTDATQTSYSYGIENAQIIQKASTNHYQPASEWLSYIQTTETVTRNNQPVQLINRVYQNGFGQTVLVRSALPPYVFYRYDVAGNLLDALTWDGATTFSENGQTYAQGIATALAYDLAGRKINLTDADMGSWDYAYDGANNLTRQKDAKTQVTCLYYDGLNRIKGKNYQGDAACPGDPGSGYIASYTYDTFSATNSGRGRRTGMSDYSGSTVWEYDLRGRLIHEAKTILDKADGNKNLGTYHTYWSYNSDGSIRQMVYPNQETVNYAYTLQGSVSQVYSVQDATNTTKYYVSATGYNAAGQAVNRTLGNGIIQTFTYYPWAQQGGRLQNILAQKSGVPIYQNLSSTYDEVGNIHSSTDSVAGETLTFTYDNLNRLDLVTGAYNEDPAYSSLTGNLSSRNGITYNYADSTHKHAVTSTTDGRSFVYDANGSMTARSVTGGPFTLGYDSANQVTSINGGSTNARYVYDGDGKRVLAVVNGVRTVYVGDYFEAELGAATTYPVSIPVLVNNPWKVFLPVIMSDGTGSGGLGMGTGNFGNTVYYTHPVATGQASITWRTYYAAGTARVAMRVQGNNGSVYDLYYFLTDNLNSTTKTIKQDGTVSELRYSAWGETRYSSGTAPTKRQYTGQILAETGLYYYGSRWYDASLSRWLQPDSIIPSPYDPLDWDRYSYVRNNSIKYNDPSGHCPFCLIVGGIAIGSYYIGVGFGLTADLIGVSQAEAAMGGGGATEVAAGLAVQGEFSFFGVGDNVAALVAHGDPFSPESGFGLAQTNAKEISALGLSGNPNDPSVAVKVMQARIENGQQACHGCTARDRIVVAALAQNGGISQVALSRWSDSANGKGIRWEDYFKEQFGKSKNAADAQFRESITGIRYPTYFMVLKYVRDLLELHQRGWSLPYGVTVEQLRNLEKWAESNGAPDGGG